ncbi:unnamed protein product [Plutella xylostella]|uniref:(diamondback moth) hypothetical protein n=1 Tax=Plutella xylostella TaxID=51655 RepID=A0A8S4G850_PLUXY|nr:unnamed protein product [Plutella xylostella]
MPEGDDKTEYLCTIAEHGLTPIITIPTRNNNCIDHILVKTKYKSEGLVCKTSVCDHDIPMAFISIEDGTKNNKRQHLKTDYDAVAVDLELVDWSDILSSSDVNEAANKFTFLIKECIDKNTKLISVSRSMFNYKPWITPGLIRCMIQRDRLHLKSRKSPNDATARLIYTRYRNFCKEILRKVKAQYEKNLLNESKEHPKKLWSAIKSICEIKSPRNHASELISAQGSEINSINSHFATIGSVLADKIILQTGKTETELAALAKASSTPTSFFLNPTDPQEISEYIKQLKNESAPGLDGIKNPLLKTLSSFLIKPLTHISICMAGGVCVFPAGWGEGAVQETCGPAADQYHLARHGDNLSPAMVFVTASLYKKNIITRVGRGAAQETWSTPSFLKCECHCHIRWAYMLALVACLDGAVLCALAFLLATRHVTLQPGSFGGHEMHKALVGLWLHGTECATLPHGGAAAALVACLDGAMLCALAFLLATRHVTLQPGSFSGHEMHKGEVNNAYVTDATSISGSRKSLALQPVLIMHPHAPMDMDTYSHYSGRTARSKHGIYANTMHNYQL